jgi:hypothetical protein
LVAIRGQIDQMIAEANGKVADDDPSANSSVVSELAQEKGGQDG